MDFVSDACFALRTLRHGRESPHVFWGDFRRVEEEGDGGASSSSLLEVWPPARSRRVLSPVRRNTHSSEESS